MENQKNEKSMSRDTLAHGICVFNQQMIDSFFRMEKMRANKTEKYLKKSKLAKAYNRVVWKLQFPNNFR
jgi:hypothetical protein